MKLLPFDIEKALAGEPVINRQGDELTGTFYYNENQKMSVLYKEGEGTFIAFDSKGKYSQIGEDCCYDLFMKPKLVLVNLDEDYSYTAYSSKDTATDVTKYYNYKTKRVTRGVV